LQPVFLNRAKKSEKHPKNALETLETTLKSGKFDRVFLQLCCESDANRVNFP